MADGLLRRGGVLFLLLAAMAVGAQRVPAQAPNGSSNISIRSADWANPQASISVKGLLATKCDGKVSCEGLVNDFGFPQPSNMPRVKSLKATFTCGGSGETYSLSTSEYARFRIDCGSPTAPQPTLVLNYLLEEQTYPGFPKSGDYTIAAPGGYGYCWDYTFDISKREGQALATSSRDGNDLKIHWELSPRLAGGRAWIERIFMLAVHRTSDPNAACPPRP